MEKILIFELFSGVGWCNTVFSLESAIYLANITKRKLVVFIKYPFAHCGKIKEENGVIFDYISDEFKRYLPNGFEYYLGTLPNKYQKDSYLKLDVDVVKWSGIVFVDKDLDIPENHEKINHFLNGRLKRYLRDELFQDSYKNIYLCGSNASRCFYNFFTTQENYILMNKISNSLRILKPEIQEICDLYLQRLYAFLNTQKYLAIHFRFGDIEEDNLHYNKTDAQQIINNIKEWVEHNPEIQKLPLVVMADRRKPFLEELGKYFYLVFNSEIPIDNQIRSICNSYFGNQNKIIEFLIQKYACERAEFFIGTNRSTLSAYISHYHYLNNKPSDLITKYWHGKLSDLRILNKRNSHYTWHSKEYPLDHHLTWQHFWEDEIYHMYDDLYLKIVKLRHIEKKHKKIVSYWFNDDSDERGILINYHNIKKYYPGWLMRIYYPSNKSFKVLQPYLNFKDIEIFIVTTNIENPIFSLLPYDDREVDIFISRNLNCIISKKEAELVDEWQKSNNSLHLIHSNNLQTREIVLDLFGIKNDWSLNLLYEMLVLAKNSSLIDKDYEIVSETLYINYINDYIQHYSGGFKHENSKKFSVKELEYGTYLGENCVVYFDDLYNSIKFEYFPENINISKSKKRRRKKKKKNSINNDSKVETLGFNTTNDLISVIIDCNNNYTLLMKIFEIINNQTYKNLELILVNVNPDDERFFYKIDNCIVVNITKSIDLNNRETELYKKSIGRKLSSGKYLFYLNNIDGWDNDTLMKYYNESKHSKLIMT